MGPSADTYGRSKGPPGVDALLAAAAPERHAVFSIGELTDLGLTERQRLRRVATARLHRLYPGVFALGHVHLTPRGLWRAAVLACGSDAALSHYSAAAFWGIRRTARRDIDVTTPQRGRKGHAGITLHRVRTLDPRDVTVHDSVRVTSVARTLVDLADVLDDYALRKAIRESELNDLFDLAAIEDACDRVTGRRGPATLRRLVALPAPPTRSVLEDRFFALCETAGVPLPQVNVHVGGYEVDFFWPSHNLVVETDGAKYHRTRDAYERDPIKTADLTVMGYTVIRFTWQRITQKPHEVVATLRALLL